MGPLRIKKTTDMAKRIFYANMGENGEVNIKMMSSEQACNVTLRIDRSHKLHKKLYRSIQNNNRAGMGIELEISDVFSKEQMNKYGL